MEKGRKKEEDSLTRSVLHVHVPLFVAAHTYTPTYMLLSIEIASPSGLILFPPIRPLLVLVPAEP